MMMGSSKFNCKGGPRVARALQGRLAAKTRMSGQCGLQAAGLSPCRLRPPLFMAAWAGAGAGAEDAVLLCAEKQRQKEKDRKYIFCVSALFHSVFEE